MLALFYILHLMWGSSLALDAHGSDAAFVPCDLDAVEVINYITFFFLDFITSFLFYHVRHQISHIYVGNKRVQVS